MLKSPVSSGTIIGIDPSLTGFAICSISNQDITFREYSSKAAKLIQDRMDRYEELLKEPLAFIQQNKPQLIVLEGYSYGSKGRGTITLGEFGGVLRYSLRSYMDRLIEVPPTVLKKFTTGSGNCSKDKMVSLASSKYRMVFNTNNEVDAFCLAKLGMCLTGYDSPTANYQEKVIEDLKGTYSKLVCLK